MIPRIALANGVEVAALGQGTWHMGERAERRQAEIAALTEGIERGMTLIDTAEMYADGGAERVIGEAIAGRREQVFLVSKVYPHNASRRGVASACARSLKRLGTEHIDLYLLHWPGSIPLEETIEGFESLRRAGHIGAWGVSNFDADAMDALWRLPGGAACATDQVLYHPDVRGIEYDLLPWCQRTKLPVMAYSPLGQGGTLLRSKALRSVAGRHGATPAQIAIAWSLRSGQVISIPKSGDPEHLRENAEAVTITLTDADLADIDAAHPPPARKHPLSML